MSWGGGDFYAHSTQYRHGIPSWVGFNDVVTEGELPPLPDADNAKSGLQFQPLNFVFACLILLAVSAVLLWPVSMVKINAVLAIPLFSSSALVGMFMPPDLTCLAWGAVLAVAAALCVGMTVKSSSEILVLLCAASLIYWWGFRIGHVVLKSKSEIHIPDYAGFDDLIVWSAMFVPALAIGIACQLLRRNTTKPIGK